MIKLNKTKALQWQNEALTVKGQSLFLFLKSAHSYLDFISSIMNLPNTRRFWYGNNL